MFYRKVRKKMFFAGKTFNPDSEYISKAVDEFLELDGRIEYIENDSLKMSEKPCPREEFGVYE